MLRFFYYKNNSPSKPNKTLTPNIKDIILSVSFLLVFTRYKTNNPTPALLNEHVINVDIDITFSRNN